MSERVPDEDVDCAKDLHGCFRSLKAEIDMAMTEVHAKLALVSQKIEANINSKDNPGGLLMQGQ